VTSGPAQTVSIESDDGGPIYVRVPTLLEESHWDRILAGQPNVTDVTVDANDRLVIELRPGTYNLRMAEVGFGPNVEDEPAAYITDIEGGGETVLTGTTTTLTAEVRDQYNNPVANEEVTVDLENGSGEFIDSDGNSLGSGSYTTQTDTNGEVTVRFRPTGNSTHDVTVTGDFGGKPSADRVRFRIRSAAAVGGGVSSGGVSAINPGAGAEQVRLTGVTTTNGSKNVQLTFNNDAPVELSMTEMRISYYLSDDGTAAANNGTFSYGGDTETLVVYDEFVEVPGPTFASEGSGGSEVQTVAINDLKNNVKGDFMIVSVRYADGADNERTITYFVGIP
jgi:hypothetical protein